MFPPSNCEVKISSSSSAAAARVELVSSFVLKTSTIYFLAFLDHVFLTVDNVYKLLESYF
jgi:hypothetical protein